jgi:hypothetical protein
VRYQELKLAYPEATEQQVIGAIQNEEREVARVQLQSGRNPYDYAYQLAKLRGYTAAATTAPASAGTASRALPQVEAPRVMAPDTTLNTVSGSAPGEPEDGPESDEDILSAAMAERFPRARRA